MTEPYFTEEQWFSPWLWSGIRYADASPFKCYCYMCEVGRQSKDSGYITRWLRKHRYCGFHDPIHPGEIRHLHVPLTE